MSLQSTVPKLSSSGLAKPLFATARSEGVVSRGIEVEAVLAEFGITAMDWQSQVLEVGLEVDGEGRPSHKRVVVSVCRQQGKTIGIIAGLVVHRMLLWGEEPQRIIYGAQTLKDGVDKWRDEIWPMLVQSPFYKLGKLRDAWSMASPGIRSEATGSVLRITGQSESTGHGATVHLVVMDEAWKLPDDAREQAVAPAMITVPDSQLWIVSTAGTPDYPYFRREVLRGRRLVEIPDTSAQTAYFEWGLREDDDWEDESLWPDAIPALGTTIRLEDLRQRKATMEPDEFRRAHLNQWPTGTEGDLPVRVWNSVRAGPGQAVRGEKWLAADVPPRMLGGGGLAVAGDGVVGVIEVGEGPSWLTSVVRGFVEKWGKELGGLAVVRGGPLAAVADVLESDYDLKVLRYSWHDISAACERFYVDVLERRVAIQAHSKLDEVAKLASARDRLLSGTWTWQSRVPGRSVSLLLAVTMAHDLYRRSLEEPVRSWVTSMSDFDEAELDLLAAEMGV